MLNISVFCFVAVQGCVCFGLDLGLFLVVKFQQDNSGLSMLKMRDAVGLKEICRKQRSQEFGLVGYSMSLCALDALNWGF